MCSPHVCEGQHIRTLILQAGTNSEFNHIYMFHVKHIQREIE